MALNIEKMNWSDPIPAKGKYYRMALDLPLEFWEEWLDDKAYLKSKGIVVYRDGDQMKVALWTDTEGMPNALPKPKNEVGPLPPIESKLGSVELFPPQVIHTQHLVRGLRQHPTVIDTSEVGTGKTPCAILAAHNLGMTPVVVCPKVVVPSWKDWAEKAGVHIEVINYDMAIRGNFPFCHRTKTKRPAYMQFEWDVRYPERYLLVFDEAHALKGEESLRSCLLSSAKRSGMKSLLLSATLLESPKDMKSIGYVMGFHHWSNWEDFLRENSCFTQSQNQDKWIRPAGKKAFKKSVPVKKWVYMGGKEGMKKIHSKIFPAMGHGLLKSDMKGYFPDNFIMPLQVDIGKVEAVWKTMRKELRELEMKKKRDTYRGDSKLTIMLRAQQEAELLKVPSIIERAKDLEEEGCSVVIFSQFRESLDKIRDALGAVRIVGGQGEAERADAIARFQADKERFICVQLQAGGAGISLHQVTPDKRPRASLTVPAFNARDFAQALGRIHRAGSTDTVRQYIVFDRKSATDQRVCKSIESKLSNINALNGDHIEDICIIESRA